MHSRCTGHPAHTSRAGPAVSPRRGNIRSVLPRQAALREAFCWLAILVTFALRTAANDWTLELTGWTPGVSVLLPTVLILSIVVGWRLGANPVLSFWLPYVLTRPLGANMGNWLALPKADGGLDLGAAGTSVIFLTAILATVIYLYLAIKRPDVIEDHGSEGSADRPRRRRNRDPSVNA
jgi:uncharacterized membrane-anchored protein